MCLWAFKSFAHSMRRLKGELTMGTSTTCGYTTVHEQLPYHWHCNRYVENQTWVRVGPDEFGFVIGV